MIVLVTNLTDAPGHARGPTQVDIYNKTLNPGASIKIPADLVDRKIRLLAEGDAPLISIGNLPPWYVTAKTSRGKPLSAEERKRRLAPSPPAPAVKSVSKKAEKSDATNEITKNKE